NVFQELDCMKQLSSSFYMSDKELVLSSLFDYFQLCIGKPDLSCARENQSKANEDSIFRNGDGCFISPPIMGSLHHVLGSQVLISSVRANVETSLLFHLFDFDLT